MTLVCDFIVTASLHIIALNNFINKETGNGDLNVSSNREKPFPLGTGQAQLLACVDLMREAKNPHRTQPGQAAGALRVLSLPANYFVSTLCWALL